MSSGDPRVSVLIPTYRRATHLALAIDSALAQTCQDLEIIVVEDGSHIAAEVVGKYGSRVRYEWQPNGGVAAARNTAARVSRGEWLAFLDDDDVWFPEKLERQLALAECFPSLGLVYTHYLDVEEAARPKRRSVPTSEERSGWVTAALFLRFFGLPSTVMVRRADFERVGGFDASLRFCEDYDLWLRLSRMCPFGYLAEPLVGYRRQSGSLSDNDLAVDSGSLTVLERFLSYSPTLWDECGPRQVRRRLAAIHFRCGQMLFWNDNLLSARRHFLEAWRLEPRELRRLALALGTTLPVGMVARLRALKHRLRPGGLVTAHTLDAS
jgi:glycosyltransferase involved in cell wall biosynthesis